MGKRFAQWVSRGSLAFLTALVLAMVMVERRPGGGRQPVPMILRLELNQRERSLRWGVIPPGVFPAFRLN
ncbi:hypothetical protein HRbin21_00555 [bacterium HR21]|jgi:hypothetical protein|nr:hypothetical protein HRbin21_00555 [bacterium HR21]